MPNLCLIRVAERGARRVRGAEARRPRDAAAPPVHFQHTALLDVVSVNDLRRRELDAAVREPGEVRSLGRVGDRVRRAARELHFVELVVLAVAEWKVVDGEHVGRVLSRPDGLVRQHGRGVAPDGPGLGEHGRGQRFRGVDAVGVGDLDLELLPDLGARQRVRACCRPGDVGLGGAVDPHPLVAEAAVDAVRVGDLVGHRRDLVPHEVGAPDPRPSRGSRVDPVTLGSVRRPNACCLGNRRLGVIQLNRRRRIVAANDAAHGILRAGTALFDADGELRALGERMYSHELTRGAHPQGRMVCTYPREREDASTRNNQGRASCRAGTWRSRGNRTQTYAAQPPLVG